MKRSNRIPAPPRSGPLFRKPTLQRGPALCVAFASLCCAAVSLWVPEPPLMAAGAVLLLYGACGVVLSPARWREGRPLVLVLLGLLPMGLYLEAYLGFPARLATAEAVARALQVLDVATLSAGSVLQLEGRESYVDSPCSGMKSLRWGVLAYASALWLQGRSPGWRALGLGGLLAAALWFANTGRVFVLVGLVDVLQMPVLADLVHVPLGLLGFGLCLGGALWCTRSLPQTGTPEPTGGVGGSALWLAFPLAVALGLLLWRSAQPVAMPDRVAKVPAGLQTLTPDPQDSRRIAEQGGRLRVGRFWVGGAQGELALVTAETWRAQHLPAICLGGQGWTLSGERPERVGGELVRWADTARGAERGTALWWYQSAWTVTDDYGLRVWRGMRERTWTMVSMVIQGAKQPEDPELHTFVMNLRAHIAGELRE